MKISHGYQIEAGNDHFFDANHHFVASHVKRSEDRRSLGDNNKKKSNNNSFSFLNVTNLFLFASNKLIKIFS